MKSQKVIALINEVAGKLWFENLPYFFANIGYHLEPKFFKFYKNCFFIVASKSTYDDIQKMGVSKKSITIIHNGLTKVEIDKKIIKEYLPTIIFLGRISKDKGISDALRAFKIVKGKVNDAQFWIVGKEEKPGILGLLFKMQGLKKIDKDIHHFGFVDEKKKFELLKRAHLLIHPSHKEGWGLTVIEAASQGTPTVGYNVEGLRDSIVNGKTGILTQTNPADLAENIIKLIEDKNAYKSMSKHALQRSREFNWKESTKKSWEILKNVY